MELFHIYAIDYPRWPPGTIAKNSINTKMTISQDPLVEIDPTFCQNVSCMNPLYYFCSLGFQDGCCYLNSAEHENDNISIFA